MIKDLKEEKITAETIISSFIVRGVQPIKRQTAPVWPFKESDNTGDGTDRPDLKRLTNHMKKLLQPYYDSFGCDKVGVAYSSENPRPPVRIESL